jgi:hypothetical protein
MPSLHVGSWRSAVIALFASGPAAAILLGMHPVLSPALAADGPGAVRSVQTAPAEADAAAIRAAATAYREALAKGDAAAIRQAWTADGDVVDGWGNLLSVADVSAAGGAGGGPRPEIRVGETRLRLITADVVIEDGSVDVVLPGSTAPLEGRFSAIWVKQGGAWKLAGIREAERPPAQGGEMLDDLDWMVGAWTLVPEDGAAKDAVPAMRMTARWDAGRMFLVRDIRLESRTAAGEPVTVDVQQRIGWDPLSGRVRSWSFSSDGTRGEATWFRDGNSWISKGTAIQADGTQATTVTIYSYDGRDRCLWRTMQDPFAADDQLPVRATWVRQPKEGQP